MTDPLWHRSKALYKPGDLIQPGNWGRVVLGMGAGHNFYLREYVLEKIRAKEYPPLPSRLEATFAYVSQNAALRSFVDHGLYEVEVVDETAATHRADIDWVDSMPGCRKFDDLEDAARRYWDGVATEPGNDTFEIVSTSALRVVQRVLFPAETKLAAAMPAAPAPTIPTGPRELPQVAWEADGLGSADVRQTGTLPEVSDAPSD